MYRASQRTKKKWVPCIGRQSIEYVSQPKIARITWLWETNVRSVDSMYLALSTATRISILYSSFSKNYKLDRFLNTWPNKISMAWIQYNSLVHFDILNYDKVFNRGTCEMQLEPRRQRNSKWRTFCFPLTFQEMRCTTASKIFTMEGM